MSDSECSELSGSRLRAALSAAGLTREEFAELVKVDTRTVRRWLSGVIPRPRHRLEIAKTLGKSERELWPEATPEPQPRAEQSNRPSVHPTAHDLRVPNWRDLLEQASHQIDIYDWSAAGLLTHPEILALLTAKATSGTAVRILIASLQSLWLAIDDLEPDTEGSRSLRGRPLYRSIERAHELLLPLAEQNRLDALQVIAPRSPSILRFDQHILAAIHTWSNAKPGPLVLYYEPRSEPDPFQQLCAHFDAIWARAWPLHQSRQEHPDDDANPTAPGLEGQHNSRGWRRRAVLTPYGRRPPRRRG